MTTHDKGGAIDVNRAVHRDPQATLTPLQRRKMLRRAIAGAAFEYYSYSAFAIFAPFFSGQFFVTDRPEIAVLNTLMVFAVGFVMRPLSAILAGRFADRYGRKPIMLASLGLAAGGSLLLAITPTYQSIGIAAVVVLIVARVAQGAGDGAESVSGFIYTAEIADRRRRAFHCCAYPAAFMLGIIPASLLGVILTATLTEAEMQAWGWRIPFALGAVMGVFVLIMRRSLAEPDAFVQGKAHEAGPEIGKFWTIVWENRRSVLRLSLLWPAFALAYFTLAVSYSEYAISYVGAEPNDAYWASLTAQLLYLVSLPLWAKVSDRFGRRVAYSISLGGLALLVFPLQMMLGPSYWQLAIPMSIGLVVWGAAHSSEVAYINELLPNRVRAQVMAIPSSIGAVVFGGTAPYLRTWASVNGSVDWFTAYVVVLCLIALITTIRLPETKGRDLSEEFAAR